MDLYIRGAKALVHRFTDYESGIRGYTVTVGREICEEWLHPHHDPHKHPTAVKMNIVVFLTQNASCFTSFHILIFSQPGWFSKL